VLYTLILFWKKKTALHDISEHCSVYVTNLTLQLLENN
jgi:hypothetical protein